MHVAKERLQDNIENSSSRESLSEGFNAQSGRDETGC